MLLYIKGLKTFICMISVNYVFIKYILATKIWPETFYDLSFITGQKVSQPSKHWCVCLTQDSPFPRANLKIKPIQLVCSTIHSFMCHSLILNTSLRHHVQLNYLDDQHLMPQKCHAYFSMILGFCKANEWASSNHNKTNKLMTGQAIKKMRSKNIYHLSAIT